MPTQKTVVEKIRVVRLGKAEDASTDEDETAVFTSTAGDLCAIML
jgi:hypothetical protein